MRGIQVECPKCGRNGLAVTRWVRGASLKPVCILHRKSGTSSSVCELTAARSEKVREMVTVRRGDVAEVLRTRKSFVLFSGGKDSLATLLSMRDLADENDADIAALHVDTTAGLPQTTKYVKKVCNYLNVELVTVRPKVDFFTRAERWGIPSHHARWCCKELKIRPIRDYLRSIDEPTAVFDGIRSAESNVRQKYIPIWYHPSFRCISVSPIFDWGEDKVFATIRNNGIPKTLMHSLLTSSTECWCGAYKTENDFRRLYDIDRAMYARLSGLEGKMKGYTFLYRNGVKKSLKQLEREIAAEA